MANRAQFTRRGFLTLRVRNDKFPVKAGRAQFVKHAFGLTALDESNDKRLRLYFDRFPDTREEAERFRGYLMGLNRNREFERANLHIQLEDIAEVDSHDHVLLQCADIVMGAMAFRLNDRHKEKLAQSRRRGKRTIAKEKLYKFILQQIRSIRPGFNPGVSTGGQSDPTIRLNSPYLHWCFTPYGAEYEPTKTKRGKN